MLEWTHKKSSITIFRVDKGPANFPAGIQHGKVWHRGSTPCSTLPPGSAVPGEGFSPSQAPDFQARWWARGQVSGMILRQS